MTQKHLTDQKFSDLPLDQRLQQGLAEAGFEYCTPIQAESLPHALEGKDVAGQAKTGTGKTIAFLLACCHQILSRPPLEGHEEGEPRALILAPTRELAIQIHKDALLLNKFTGLSIGLVYGGTGYDQQRTMLSGTNDILVGTPGRLIDFFRQGLFSLKHAEIAILDEADRMFDLGFIKDIRFLLRKMPPAEKRLNLLFSATLSYRVMELAYEHMNNPMEIKIDSDEVVADKVVETSFYPSDEEKLPLLVNMLKQIDSERVLVFVNTRYAAEDVSNTLRANDIESGTLSGDVPQNKREKLLEQFKAGKKQVLVATDVAARGLHIPSVSHVFNFDLPQDAEDYVHRIGRTARAGASGEAISFICEKYAYSIMEIEEYIGHALPRQGIDPALLTPVEKAAPRKRKPRDGKGPDRGRKGRGEGRGKETRDTRGRGRGDRKKPDRSEDTVTAGNVTAPSAPPESPVAEQADTPATPESTTSAPPTMEPAEPATAGTAPSATQPAAPVPAVALASDTAASAESVVTPDTPATPGELPEGLPGEAPGEAKVIEPPRQRFSRRFGEVPAIG